MTQRSTRLTTDIRDTIAKRLLQHRFAKEYAALVSHRAALAVAFYNDIYKPKDRRVIEGLPKGWLPTAAALRIQVAGSVTEVAFSGARWGDPAGFTAEPTFLPVADKHMRGVAATYEASHRLAIRYAELRDRSSYYRSAVTEARRQVVAALEAATTTGKLREIWPEAAPFCAPFEKAPSRLPAVPTARLNEMLGLSATA